LSTSHRGADGRKGFYSFSAPLRSLREVFFIHFYSYATAGAADKSATPDDSGVRHGATPEGATRKYKVKSL